MRRLISLALVFCLLRFGITQTLAQSALLPPHTEVEIELLENISSENLKAGQSVSFKIVRPVLVNGTTVIAANTPVSGEVKAVQTSGAWHKAGSFDLVLKAVRLDDGSLVKLDFQRPKLRGTRKEKTGTAIATGIALTYYFPLIPVALIGGARKGKPYTIRSGERYLVYVVSSERPSDSATEPAQQKSPEQPEQL